MKISSLLYISNLDPSLSWPLWVSPGEQRTFWRENFSSNRTKIFLEGKFILSIETKKLLEGNLIPSIQQKVLAGK